MTVDLVCLQVPDGVLLAFYQDEGQLLGSIPGSEKHRNDLIECVRCIIAIRFGFQSIIHRLKQ